MRVLAYSSVAAGAFVGLVFLLYAISSHVNAGDSDKATTMLVGQAIGDGHLLLHGWVLPPATYWTTDALFYAVATRLVGLQPGLLFLEPAVMAALTIVVGVLVAREGRRGAAAVAGGVAVVALLGFATPAMDLWFVGKGFHVGTGLYALIAMAALRRGRFGWGWVLAVGLLAFGMLGDLQIVAYAVAPLFVAGVVAMLRQRRWQSGVAQVSAGVASAALGEALRKLASALGAFRPGQSLYVATAGQMLTNLRHVLTYGADLVGLNDGLYGPGGVPLALREVHVVAAICMLACFVVAFVTLVSGVVRGCQQEPVSGNEPELWRLDDMLVVAVFGSLAPFVVLAQANGPGIHYLVVPIVIVSVLTGRMVARAWSAIPAGRTARLLAIAGTALCLSFAAGVGFALSRPRSPNPAPALAAWLESHHLRNGIGGYWTASITTVESAGAVVVRPVSERDGELQRTPNQSAASWYADKRFQFLVYTEQTLHSVDLLSATKTWGTPAHLYVVGPYRVLVWSRPLVVSAFPPDLRAAHARVVSIEVTPHPARRPRVIGRAR